MKLTLLRVGSTGVPEQRILQAYIQYQVRGLDPSRHNRPAENFGIGFACASDHLPEREALFVTGPARRAQPDAQTLVRKQFRERPSHRSNATGWHEQACLPVFHKLGDPANVRGDHRQPGTHRFEDADGQTIYYRSKDEYIRAAKKLLDIVAVSEEIDAVANAQFCNKPLRGGTRGPVSDQLQTGGKIQFGKRANDGFVIFEGTEPGNHCDDRYLIHAGPGPLGRVRDAVVNCDHTRRLRDTVLAREFRVGFGDSNHAIAPVAGNALEPRSKKPPGSRQLWPEVPHVNRINAWDAAEARSQPSCEARFPGMSMNQVGPF